MSRSSRQRNRKYILASAALMTVLAAGFFTIQTRETRIEEAATEVSFAPAAIMAARPLIPGRTVTQQDLGWKEITEDELSKLLDKGAFIARDGGERQMLSSSLVGRSVLSLVPAETLVTDTVLSATVAEVEQAEDIATRSQYPLTPDLAVFVTRHGFDLDYLFVEYRDGAYEPVAMGRPERNGSGALAFSFTPEVVDRLVQIREAGNLHLQLDSRQAGNPEDGIGLSISRSEMSWFSMQTGKFQLWALSEAEGLARFRRISTDFDLVERDGRVFIEGTQISETDFFEPHVFLLNKREIMGLGNGACGDGLCTLSAPEGQISARLLGERLKRISVQRQQIGLVEQIGSSLGETAENPEETAKDGVISGALGEK